MVRMMEYLTVSQTLDYLRERMPAPFDLPQLADICRNAELTALFAYDGYVILSDYESLTEYFEFSGYATDLRLSSLIDGRKKELNIDKVKLTDILDLELNDDERSKYLILLNDNFSPTHHRVEKGNILFDLDKQQISISINDLRFSRFEVQNLPTETSVTNKILHIAQWGEDEKIGIINDLLPLEQDKEIKKLHSKAKLTSIEQAGKDTQSDTPADRGQGDSLLILGAVMATIEQVAKTNYTQASFIENHILPKYGHINGISESTLQKKFSQAKTYLKQKV